MENTEYFLQIEKEWLQQQRRLTIQEELEAFPEMESILRRNLRIFMEKVKTFKQELLGELKGKVLEDYQLDFIIEVKIMQDKEIQEAINNLTYIESTLKRLNMIKNNTNNDTRYEEAKLIAIHDVVQRLGLKIIKDKISCPFHHEKTASCHLYKNTNTFKCFGCAEYGDSIAFVMKFLQMDFKSAINFILNC